MAMNVVRVANVEIGRMVLVAGLAAMVFSCDRAAVGGQKMAANQYQWKDLWRGTGPPRSPTGAPSGLTIVHSKAAWTRVITPYYRSDDNLNNPKVDWAKELILSIQADIDNPDSLVHLQSISSDGKTMTIAAVVRLDPDNPVSREVEVRPWLVASAPAAAFAGNPTVKFSIDGRDMPVFHEK